MAPTSALRVLAARRPGKEYPPMTAGAHKKAFGDTRVSLLDVLKRVRPHSPTTQALEEKAEREGQADVDDETPMKAFTEEDWVRIQNEAIPLASTAPEVKRRVEGRQRDQCAARRRGRQSVELPIRRSIRRTEEVSYAESSGSEYVEPTSASSSGSSKLFVSPTSENFTPRSRGKKRKRAVEAAATAAATRSPSRSVTPAPPIKKRSTRRTTLDDSDDEMAEASRSRSVTPAPPIKRRKVAGRRGTVLEDSDDEMAEASPGRSRSVTPAPPIR